MQLFRFRMKMKKQLFLLLSLCCLTACQDDPLNQAPQIVVPSALLAERQAQQAGEHLFVRHCRECHGTASEGRVRRTSSFKPPAPDFYAHKYATINPAYLFWRIRDGKSVEPFFSEGSVMPVFGPHFSDKQIWQLVAYLRSRASSPENSN